MKERTMAERSERLDGKVAVVTGGGRGIGAAIAERLAGMGAALMIVGRTESTLVRRAEQIRNGGGRCELATCDISQWNSVEGLARRVEQSMGRLDILVNNAGVM